MLSQIDKSECIQRRWVPAVGALTSGRRIPPRSAWAKGALGIGLNRAEPRSFMRHSRRDSRVAQPEYRRAIGKIRAGREGTVH